MIHFKIIPCLLVIWAMAGCSENHSTIESAVLSNDVSAVREFIRSGSDVRQGSDGTDLVFAATGPKGGPEVLKELLKAGASPDGLDPGADFTPLMNAASWVSLESCRLLLEAGADRSRVGDAIKVVGRAGGSEREVLSFLEGFRALPGKDSDRLPVNP